jgi:alpha-glucosidase
MPWANVPGGGFTPEGVRPWLPMADPAACNVADQAADPDSVLAFTRRAIAGRAANPELALGSYASLASPEGTWAFRRGDATTVAINLSDQPRTFEGRRGRVTLATDRALEGEPVDGTWELGPWRGAVIEA